MFRIALLALVTLFSSLLHADPLPRYFNKRFEGSIAGNLGVTLLLERNNDELSGTYFYHSKKLPIPLIGKINNDESISLREYIYDAKGEETISGYWSGTLTSKGLPGFWKKQENGDGSDILLKETYGADSAAVTTIPLASSWKQRRGEEEMGAETDYRYLQLTSSKPASQRINDRLRQYFYGQVHDENPKKAGMIPTAADIEAQVWESGKEDIDWDMAYVADYIRSMSVVYNQDYLFCIRLSHYEFTGGAHGNSAAEHVVFDLATGEELTLKRLLKPGYEKDLLAAGRAALLAASGAKPTDSLVEAGLFEDKLELNDNWSVSANGISFSYDPYEIACYARGFVEFTIPWEKVRPWIRPDQQLAPFVK